MNYKREMKKMLRHRELYRPAMAGLLAMYTADAAPFPVEITDTDKMRILLELIDIGYLDEEAIIVRRSFGDITNLAYNGGYPFTEAGNYFFCEKKRLTIHGILKSFIKKYFKR